MLKRILSMLLILLLSFSCFGVYSSADTDLIDTDGEGEGSLPTVSAPDLGIDAKSVILMEPVTGTILYEMNAEEALPPASVTKVMTLLLVWEALDSGVMHLQDKVTVSAYAASMGGSQVFLEEGEEMTVEDLVKCTVIASANDAAVALAEHLMGTESAFVEKMNIRAGELGMQTAHFENVTGLDDDTVNHVLSAKDIAIATRELSKHKGVFDYASLWMDTIRDGAFTLTNTNRLIRFYDGATGLKTGSTEKAKFCISATATRDGMDLIAVIMGAPSRDARNNAAKALFNWGFSTYTLYHDPSVTCENVPVSGGTADSVATRSQAFTAVVPKADLSKMERTVSMQPGVSAPVKAGDTVGTVTYTLNGEVCGTAPIFASQTVEEITFWSFLVKLIKIFTLS